MPREFPLKACASKAVYCEFPRAQNKVHDTAKPLPLMRALVTDFSLPGELVIDPLRWQRHHWRCMSYARPSLPRLGVRRPHGRDSAPPHCR